MYSEGENGSTMQEVIDIIKNELSNIQAQETQQQTVQNSITLPKHLQIQNQKIENARLLGTQLLFSIKNDLPDVIIGHLMTKSFRLGVFAIPEVDREKRSLLEWVVHFNSSLSFRDLISRLKFPVTAFIRPSSTLLRICQPGYEQFYGSLVWLDYATRIALIIQSHTVLTQALQLTQDPDTATMLQHRLEYLNLLQQIETTMHLDADLADYRNDQLTDAFGITIPIPLRDAIYNNKEYLLANIKLMQLLLSYLKLIKGSVSDDDIILLDECAPYGEEGQKVVFVKDTNTALKTLIESINSKCEILTVVFNDRSKILTNNNHTSINPRQQRIIDLFEQYSDELINVTIDQNEHDYTIEIPTKDDASIECNGTTYNITAQSIIINRELKDHQNHYIFVLEATVNEDEKILIMHFDQNDRPSFEEQLPEEDKLALYTIAAPVVTSIIGTLRNGDKKQRVQNKDSMITEIIKTDNPISFLNHLGEFNAFEKFRLKIFDDSSNEERTLIQWTLHLDCPRIFKTAIEHGFTLFKDHIGSNYDYFFDLNHQAFYFMAQEHKECRLGLSALARNTQLALNNRPKRPNDSQEGYYQTYSNMITNHLELEKKLKNQPEYQQVVDKYKEEILLHTWIKYHNEKKQLLKRDVQLTVALRLYFEAFIKLLNILPANEILEILTQCNYGLDQSYQDYLNLNIANLDPVIQKNIRHDELLFKTMLLNIIYALKNQNMYSGMRDGELVFEQNTVEMIPFKVQYQEIETLREALATNIPTHLRNYLEPILDKAHKAINKKLEVIKRAQKKISFFISDSNNTSIPPAPIPKAKEILNNDTLITRISSYKASSTATESNNSSILCSVFINDNKDATITVPITIERKANENDIVITKHSIRLFESNTNPEYHGIYSIDYQHNSNPLKCDVHLDAFLQSTGVNKTKMNSSIANEFKQIAQQIIVQIDAFVGVSTQQTEKMQVIETYPKNDDEDSNLHHSL